MQLSEINPFMRFAKLQSASILNISVPRAAYDYRLFYVKKTQGWFTTGNEKMELFSGDVIFFRPGMFYNFIQESEVIAINFDLTHRQSDRKKAKRPDTEEFFSPELIFENDPPEELADLLFVHNAFELEPLFHKCISHVEFRNAYSDIHTSAIIKEILSIMLQEKNKVLNRNTELVEEILIYIQTNYNKELKNSDISTAFGYHSFYLNRVLKENTGMTLHRTLLKARISNAKELLEQTELPVEIIFRETGFSDRAQFNATFRKHTGETPTEYRRKNRQ